MYSPQDPYSSQQPAGAPYYPPPGTYYQQQPAGVNPYPAQDPYSSQQPANMPYYAPQPSYPQQYPNMGPINLGQINLALGNPRAKRAMINGCISLGLSLLTLATLIGYAGLITGTFAIIYGFIGLNRSRQIPNNLGRNQAIAGIALGSVAWLIVIVSFIIRSASGGA